jgi:hypothetical protein
MTYPRNHPLSTSRLLDLADRAKVRSNPDFQRLAIAAEVTKSPSLIKAVEKTIGLKAAYEDVIQNPFDYLPDKVAELKYSKEPKVLIGVDRVSGDPFFIPLVNLTEHGLFLGQSGTGKSELFLGMNAQFLEMGINILIIDKDKVEYRVLKQYYPDLVILRATENFYFNTLQVPPGVHPKHWYTKWVEIYCKTNDLLKGSMRILLRAMEELAPYFKPNGESPTLRDVYNKVESFNFSGKQYRSSGIQDSILSTLYTTIKQLGKTCTLSKAIPIDWIANTPLIIEFKGLSDYIARFLVSCILYGIMYYRIANNHRGKILRNICCVDEAHWLLPPGLSDEKKEYSPLATLLAQCRALGLSILIGSQSAMLEPATFDNTSLKCCFRLGSGHSISEAQKALGLTYEQAAYIPKLGLGQVIVRIPENNVFGIQTLKTNFS